MSATNHDHSVPVSVPSVFRVQWPISWEEQKIVILVLFATSCSGIIIYLFAVGGSYFIFHMLFCCSLEEVKINTPQIILLLIWRNKIKRSSTWRERDKESVISPTDHHHPTPTLHVQLWMDKWNIVWNLLNFASFALVSKANKPQQPAWQAKLSYQNIATSAPFFRIS